MTSQNYTLHVLSHSSVKISFSRYPIADIAIFALSNTLPFRFGSLTSASWNAPWVEVKEYGLNEFHIFTISAGGSGIWSHFISLSLFFKKKRVTVMMANHIGDRPHEAI